MKTWLSNEQTADSDTETKKLIYILLSGDSEASGHRTTAPVYVNIIFGTPFAIYDSVNDLSSFVSRVCACVHVHAQAEEKKKNKQIFGQPKKSI